jgi:Restriction endonuclease/Topoisomerase DNA binding C4 zinc finger
MDTDSMSQFRHWNRSIGEDMARRRRRDDDWVQPVAGLVGLAVLAIVFIPGLGQMLLAVGIVAIVVFGIVAVGAIIFGIYRLATPERNMHTMTANVLAPPSRVPDRIRVNYEPQPEPLPKPETPINLIEQMHTMDWFQFEKLVGRVYQRLGYTVTRRGGANPDGGIDLIIEKDGQRTAVQCKQWKAWKVGVRTIREFVGALSIAKIPKGIFITVRGYTVEARQLAADHGIEVMDEAGLAQMLESTDARFDPDVLELLHDTRKFCPKCERQLIIRVAEKGPNPGSKFWGCSGYPRCHYTIPID